MIEDRLIDAGELPIALRDFGGDAPPLLLLHEAGGNLATMTTLARQLRPSHRVITVDLRGHGRSGDGTWSWDAALGDLAAVVVQLELANPAVAGHGLGGMLAALWGQRHPESRGVVVLDGAAPPTRVEQVPGLDADVAEAALARLREAAGREHAGLDREIPAAELPELVERERMAARDRGANEKVWIEGFRRNLVNSNGSTTVRPSAGTAAELRTLAGEFDLGSVLRTAQCPALVVLPTRDADPEFADLFAAHRAYTLGQVAGSGARHVQLADASPAMVVEQPQVLARLITDFLNSGL